MCIKWKPSRIRDELSKKNLKETLAEHAKQEKLTILDYWRELQITGVDEKYIIKLAPGKQKEVMIFKLSFCACDNSPVLSDSFQYS